MVGEGAATTSVALDSGGASRFEPGQEIKLTATITPAEATGTVTFLEGETPLGSGPVTVSDGKAELTTSALPEGRHELTARFTSANAGQWASSQSTPIPVTVAKPTVEIQDENGKRLTGTPGPELQRGQTVKVLVRGCEAGTSYSMALSNRDESFPGATADANGVVTWNSLTVPDDMVAGTSSWNFSPACNYLAGETASQASFTIAEPSDSPATTRPTSPPMSRRTGPPTSRPPIPRATRPAPPAAAAPPAATPAAPRLPAAAPPPAAPRPRGPGLHRQPDRAVLRRRRRRPDRGRHRLRTVRPPQRAAVLRRAPLVTAGGSTGGGPPPAARPSVSPLHISSQERFP
ncbi:Ig-like domain-containing protein [Streptomyces shenzhenensis]|uniref:Ig-like domain-containing protein n=1 Tax=Streptomyces shenzhenensis TaxID=943815 RepID=UPI003D8BBAAF